MWTKKIRHVYSVLLSLVLCLSILSVTCYAAGEGEPVIVDGSALLMDDYSQSWEDGIAGYGYYLATGGCSITKVQNNIARVYGFTECCRAVDTAYVGIYMDRLESDNTWHTVYQTSYTGDGPTLGVQKSINVYVKSGYYYRVRAAHIVTAADGITEANSSFTDGLYF